MKFKSLNEAIQSVTNPEPELTQEEYIDILESALESIAEELEIDPNELLEAYRMTPGREKVLSASEKTSIEKAKKNKLNPKGDADGSPWSNLPNSPRNARRQEALSKIDRIAAIRRKAAGEKESKSNTLKIRRNTHQNRKAVEIAMQSGKKLTHKDPKGRKGKYDFRYTDASAHDRTMKQADKARKAN